MRKHKNALKELYTLFPDLKDELAAVINHPLMPAEFEAAWHELVEKYGLQDVNVMLNLWDERKSWVSAYWKDVLCARMTSTQRSESMNNVLKRGFVKEHQDLHIFVQQVNNCIITRHMSETAETLASMVCYFFTSFIFSTFEHIKNDCSEQNCELLLACFREFGL